MLPVKHIGGEFLPLFRRISETTIPSEARCDRALQLSPGVISARLVKALAKQQSGRLLEAEEDIRFFFRKQHEATFWRKQSLYTPHSEVFLNRFLRISRFQQVKPPILGFHPGFF